MRELYAVRHAESAMNVQPHLVGGRSNEAELTKLGIAQAHAAGRMLLELVPKPAAVYSSPAVRTQATARYAFETMGIDPPVLLDDALYEMDQGDYVGRNRADVYTPAVINEIDRQGKDFKLPGGESMNEVGERMLEWLRLHEAEADDGPILLFGHGLAIRCLASTIENWSRLRTFETGLPNASVTHFIDDGGGWRIDFLGHTI